MFLHRENTPAADPFDIFSAFGFGGMGGGRQREEEQRTANVEIPVRVTLRQLYLGELLDVEYIRQVVCVEASSCEKKDKDCQGPGVKLRVQQLAPGFVQQIQVHSLKNYSVFKKLTSIILSAYNIFQHHRFLTLLV